MSFAMLRNSSDLIERFLKGVICLSIILAGAAGAITIAYIVVMTCYRGCGVLWRSFFDQPW